MTKTVHEIEGSLQLVEIKEAKTGKEYAHVELSNAVVDGANVGKYDLNWFETTPAKELWNGGQNKGKMVKGLFEKNPSGDKVFKNVNSLALVNGEIPVEEVKGNNEPKKKAGGAYEGMLFKEACADLRKTTVSIVHEDYIEEHKKRVRILHKLAQEEEEIFN